jgi:hypothetical protein
VENILNQLLLQYFASRSNRFSNSKGMKLGMTSGNEIWTYYSLCNHDHGPLAINISTSSESIPEFISGFMIKTVDEVDQLTYTNTWMRYLNGDAEIGVTPFELEVELGFKIDKGKTIIFSLDLHFYDEVYENLTMPEDFEKYISSHKNRLWIAAENRYKMNHR